MAAPMSIVGQSHWVPYLPRTAIPQAQARPTVQHETIRAGEALVTAIDVLYEEPLQRVLHFNVEEFQKQACASICVTLTCLTTSEGPSIRTLKKKTLFGTARVQIAIQIPS